MTAYATHFATATLATSVAQSDSYRGLSSSHGVVL